MGMESYYVSLIINRSVYNDLLQLIERECCVSQYNILPVNIFKKRVVDNSRFVIDHKAVLSFETTHEVIKITFELCFANFENNLKYLYGVVCLICKLDKMTRLEVLNSEYYLINLGYEKFENIIRQAFYEKISAFNAKYGKIEKDILPNHFYNQVRHKRCAKIFSEK